MHVIESDNIRESFAVEQGALLPVRRAGINTYRQPVLYLHQTCLVCRSEGFAAPTRVEVKQGKRQIVAILNMVTGDWLSPHEAALSEAAWQALSPEPGQPVELAHAEPPESTAVLRAKVFGGRLDAADFPEYCGTRWRHVCPT